MGGGVLCIIHAFPNRETRKRAFDENYLLGILTGQRAGLPSLPGAPVQHSSADCFRRSFDLPSATNTLPHTRATDAMARLAARLRARYPETKRASVPDRWTEKHSVHPRRASRHIVLSTLRSPEPRRDDAGIRQSR